MVLFSVLAKIIVSPVNGVQGIVRPIVCCKNCQKKKSGGSVWSYRDLHGKGAGKVIIKVRGVETGFSCGFLGVFDLRFQISGKKFGG
jgi:hypothetical protein